MGYRSQIGIVVRKDKITPRLLELLEDADSKTDREEYNATYFLYDSIKWYDTYPDVAEIMSILKALPEGSWGFIEIGEEANHIEQKGKPWEFDMWVNREIVC